MNWCKPACVVEEGGGGKRKTERLEARVQERQSHSLRLRRVESLNKSKET